MPEYDKQIEGTNTGLYRRADHLTVRFTSAERPAVGVNSVQQPATTEADKRTTGPFKSETSK